MTDTKKINEIKNEINDLYIEYTNKINSYITEINNGIKNIKITNEKFYKKSIEKISKIKLDNEISPIDNLKLNLINNDLNHFSTSSISFNKNKRKSRSPINNKNNSKNSKTINTEIYNYENKKNSQNDLRNVLINQQKKFIKDLIKYKNENLQNLHIQKRKKGNNKSIGGIKGKKIYDYNLSYHNQRNKLYENKIYSPNSVSTEVINSNSSIKKKIDLSFLSSDKKNSKEKNQKSKISIHEKEKKNNKDKFFDKEKKIENEKEKEKRKLSIIDIPYLSSNHEKKKEKEKIEKNEKIKLFKNKKEKFIFILSKSNVVPLKLRIKFCKLNSLVYKNNPPNEIINDYYNLLENKINDLKNKLNQKFYPSFTVQTELNFILKEDENYFFKSFFSNDQIILNYLKCFLIIINNNYILDNKNINCKDLINEIHKISKGNIKKILINNELINKINQFSERKLNQFIQIYSLIKNDIIKKDLPSFLKKILLFIQEIYFFLNDKNNIKIRYNNFTNEQKKLKQKQFLSKIQS